MSTPNFSPLSNLTPAYQPPVRLTYKDYRWLGAHNAWNTTPPLNNQCQTISKLLDYGVRGLSLDIWGAEESKLHLQHRADNPVSSTPWQKVRDELKTWMAAHPSEIVTLFFESYLSNKVPSGGGISALAGLENSLKDITSYVSGRAAQRTALLQTQVSALVAGNTRLFAYLQEEPDAGVQTMFPVMTEDFAENVYGDASLDVDDWVDLRDKMKIYSPLTYMNHFGGAPTGSEWDRNNVGLIMKHAHAFAFKFGGRYPNFISLDYINWDAKRPGPIGAATALQDFPNFTATGFKWDGINTFYDLDIYMGKYQVTDIKVETAQGEGITKIIGGIGNSSSLITAIQVVNMPNYGLVNLRIQKNGYTWEPWLTGFETDKDVKPENVATHLIRGTLIGFCSRTRPRYGVVDFAAASV